MQCPSCGAPLRGGVERCPACGADAPTVLATATAASPVQTGMAAGRPARETQRFVPGTVIERRYRVIALLGRGGMGEVYRADDLKLGQPVALKFLPEGLSDDPEALDRFLGELR